MTPLNSQAREADRRPSNVERRMGTCVHFRAMGVHKVCAAGVAYADVQKEHEPIKYAGMGGGKPVYTATRSLPCHAHHNHGGATCPKFEGMTREAAESREAELRAFIGGMGEARKRIVAACGDRPGGAGTVVCPTCQGTLHYSRAASNGHVWARCETAGCLAWME